MKKTNILLITSDQQHWNTLGCINPEIRTPCLDRLAEEGTRYQRAYCPNPTCTPTRASIITGKYPSQHGAWSLGTKLPEYEHTIGDVFRRHGYQSALVGKAHFQPLKGSDEFPSLESYPVLQDLEFWRGCHGPFYGFDHVELARNHADEAHVGQHYALWMEEKGCTNWRDYFKPPTGHNERQHHRWLIPEKYHYDTWISDRTNALMDRYHADGQPFFLWASFFDPHPPYLAPEPWDTMYDPAALTVPHGVPGEHDRNPPHFRLTQERKPDYGPWREPGGNGMHGFHSHLRDRAELARDMAVYYGMISLMDEHIGRIVDHLDALGLAENTLVLFTSDHGHFYGHHGLVSKGAFHYEDMVRVPFLARMPGRVAAGEVSDALISLTDLAPTMLSAAGISPPGDMTAVDQLPVLLGSAAAARDHVVVENHHQPTTIHARTYIDRRYKLTVYCDRDYGELFDLEEDPQEYRNRWDDPEASDLRVELTLCLLKAELAKEEAVPPDLSDRANKSPGMYVKEIVREGWLLVAPAEGAEPRLFHLPADPERRTNRWGEPGTPGADLVRRLLFERMRREPLWMPRIAVA